MPERLRLHRRQFLLGGTALGLLAACSPSVPSSDSTNVAPPATSQQVTIRLESYNYGTPGLGGKALQTMIDEFQAKYPSISIEGKNTSPTPDGQMNMIVTERAAGDPPDIAQLGLNSVDYAIRELGAQPIDNFAPRDEYDALMAHILPTARPLGMRNNHLYASPFTFSTPTLFYNADIFRAAGLYPESPPTTWDDVHSYALQIKSHSDRAPLNIAAIGSSGDWVAQSLVSSNGGTLLSPDGLTPTFNQPAAIETFTWLQTLVKDGTHPPLNSNDAIAAFNNGNLGMFLNSTALLYAAESAASGKFEIRTSGEPSFGTKPVHPVNSGSGLFVFATDPTRQRAAWNFLNFAASQRGFTIITSMIGYVPQRDDVVDDPNYLKPYVDKDPNLLTAFKQLPGLEPWLNWSKARQGVQAESVFVEALQNVVYAGQDPQSTMDAAGRSRGDIAGRQLNAAPPRARLDSQEVVPCPPPREAKPAAVASVTVRSRRARVELAPYLLVLPSLLLIAVWAYYPLLDTIRISFFDGTLLSGPQHFVGLSNYSAVLDTPEFQKALGNTFKYIVGMIPLAVILPMAIALLASDIKGRMRDVYRSIIFAPMIMAPVVVSLIWLWILNPLQGVLNAALKLAFGLNSVNWLGDETTALWVLVFITGWKILGFSFILYAAAITGIDRSYVEAARLDGASEWQITRHIVVPLLTPTFYFLLLFTIMFAGQWAFAPINVLTQGNPNNSTSNVFYVLYQIAFEYFNVGQAAAASVLVFLVMGVGIVFGARQLDRRSHFDN